MLRERRAGCLLVHRHGCACGLSVRRCKVAARACAQRLKEMDIEIIEDGGNGKDFGGVRAEDVVILPAFGASVQEMRLLNDRGVRIVDTTCPWVAKARPAPGGGQAPASWGAQALRQCLQGG
jgi:hypothetical protein